MKWKDLLTTFDQISPAPFHLKILEKLYKNIELFLLYTFFICYNILFYYVLYLVKQGSTTGKKNNTRVVPLTDALDGNEAINLPVFFHFLVKCTLYSLRATPNRRQYIDENLKSL